MRFSNYRSPFGGYRRGYIQLCFCCVIVLLVASGAPGQDSTVSQASLPGRIHGLARFLDPEPETSHRRFVLLTLSASDGAYSVASVKSSQPRVSHDGTSVAYETKGGRVWVGMIAPRARPKQVVSLDRPSTNGRPAWSFDAKEIILSSSIREGNNWSKKTYRFHTNGSELRLLPIPATDAVCDWSPDGTLVATISREDNAKDWQASVMALDGKGARRLSQGGVLAPLRFSPDSREVAYLQREVRKGWHSDCGGSWGGSEIYPHF